MRVVCLSDTHSLHEQVEVPEGDILLHAGDLCNHGTKGEVKAFDAWLGRQPHRHKLFIAGNHDWPFYKHRRYAEMWLRHGTYLQDRAVVLDGLKIYGSPWQPAFNNWAFNLHHRQELSSVWQNVPDDTDILITHTPPRGVLDPGRPGCQKLAVRLQELKPRLHLFGHVHLGYGQLQQGPTRFVNACICDEDYRPTRPPIVSDL